MKRLIVLLLLVNLSILLFKFGNYTIQTNIVYITNYNTPKDVVIKKEPDNNRAITSTEVLPKVPTEVLPTEVLPEVLHEVPTEILPTEVLPKVPTEVLPNEVPTEVLPNEVPTEVLPTDVLPTDVLPNEVLPKVPDEVLPKVPDEVLPKVPDEVLPKVPDEVLKETPPLAVHPLEVHSLAVHSLAVHSLDNDIDERVAKILLSFQKMNFTDSVYSYM